MAHKPTKSTIKPPPPPTPIAFEHRTWRGDDSPTYTAKGGPIRFTLPDGQVIEIEAYVRPGNPNGLMVRGIDCYLDVQPEASNTVFVKPRTP